MSGCCARIKDDSGSIEIREVVVGREIFGF